MSKKNFWIGYALGIALAISIGGYLFYKASTLPQILISELKMEDLQGNLVDGEIFSETPTVVNFWGTWCAPCIKEFPEFEKLRLKYKGKVRFIMVSDESSETIKRFVDKNHFGFEFLRSRQKFNVLGLKSRPATYFYNSKGLLISKKIGSILPEELENSIEKMLN